MARARRSRAQGVSETLREGARAAAQRTARWYVPRSVTARLSRSERWGLSIATRDADARRCTAQGSTRPRMRVLFDVRLDGRQGFGCEVVQEGTRGQRLPAPVEA